MAGSLDLSVSGSPREGITVKWMEPDKAQFHRGRIWWKDGLAALVGLLFLVFSIVSLAGGSLGMALFWIFAIIPVVIGTNIFVRRTTWIANEARFTQSKIHTKAGSFPTDRVTRFDYGIRSQMAGDPPPKEANGAPLPDPHIIRMWIDDSKAVTVSTNNWEAGINHDIRNALHSAWQKVRTAEKKQAHDEKYGRVGRDGIPDYD